MAETNWSTIDELREWLTAVHIPIHTWGKDGAKTVEALWQEVAAGETVLQSAPPQRRVQLVEVVIRRGELVLVEAAQELADGQMRQRGILPAEKMKAGEDVETAVLRGLQEELGVAHEAVTTLTDTYKKIETLKASPSYPGLPTHYTVHQFAVQITGLPDGDFWVDNESHEQGDPVKRHHWSWQTWVQMAPRPPQESDTRPPSDQ